ncbi:hypothetical protein BGW42_002592 [Actinomortierella wolfii]|nr:hypothetical protein BGW42_002592 [Actinomortierella wolfii]
MSGSRVSVADSFSPSSPITQSPPPPALSSSSSPSPSPASASHLPPAASLRSKAYQLESSSPQDFSPSPTATSRYAHLSQQYHHGSPRQRIKSEPGGSGSPSPSRHQRQQPSHSSTASASRQHYYSHAPHFNNQHHHHHQSSSWLGLYEQSSPMAGSPHHPTRHSPRADHSPYLHHPRHSHHPQQEQQQHQQQQQQQQNRAGYSSPPSSLQGREGSSSAHNGSGMNRKIGRDAWLSNHAGSSGAKESSFRTREFDPAAVPATSSPHATALPAATSVAASLPPAATPAAATSTTAALLPGNGVLSNASQYNVHALRDNSGSGGGGERLTASNVSSSGGMETSGSLQSLVESIDDDDVLRLTEMTKKVVEHSNQAQKRNRVISPPSNTQVPSEFQPSDKTLQLSNQFKAMMESRYAPIFSALENNQPLPNPLATLRETMARIDAVPRAIINKYNTTRKISMEAANAASGGGSNGGIHGSGHGGGGGGGGGLHLSRSKKSKDKYAFVSRVVESQCIWNVDHMKVKAAEIEACYQSNASNPSLRFTAHPPPPQSISMDSLATSGSTEPPQTPSTIHTTTPSMATNTNTTPVHKDNDHAPHLSSTHISSATSITPAKPVLTEAIPIQPTAQYTSIPTTTGSNGALPPTVSTLKEGTTLLTHQTHAGEGLHQPHVQSDPMIATTTSPSSSSLTRSSSHTMSQGKESAPTIGNGTGGASGSRMSLESPSTSTSNRVNGSSLSQSDTGSSLQIQQPHHQHNLSVPVHPATLETSGSKRASILGIFGIKGHKKSGLEESLDKSTTEKHRTAALNQHSVQESGSASLATNGNQRLNAASPVGNISTTVTTAERKSSERMRQPSGAFEMNISPVDTLAGTGKTTTAATGTNSSKPPTGRPSLDEPQRQQPLPGLGHGLLSHGHDDGGSTEDELSFPQFPQGERLDDSQDEGDALPHKRSSLRRFTDLIMWKRQHKGLAGLQEQPHSADALKRPIDPTIQHLQQQHSFVSSRLSQSQPSSGRNSLDGPRPKGFSLVRAMSGTSSPVLEPGLFDHGSGSNVAGPTTTGGTGSGANTAITATGSATVSPRIGPMNPTEGLQFIQRSGVSSTTDRSPMLYPRPSYLSSHSHGLSGTVSQDRSPSMRATTPNEDTQWTGADKKAAIGGHHGGWTDVSGPVLVDIERIPKAILDQLKENPALAGVSWDLDTVDLRPLLASGSSLPTCHEFFGITSAMKKMEAYPAELQCIDLLDIHVRLDCHEPKDRLRARAHVWDALEMRLDEELKLSEDFVKRARQWSNNRQGEMERYLNPPSPDISMGGGGLEDYYYYGLQAAENDELDDGHDRDNDDDKNNDMNDDQENGDAREGQGQGSRVIPRILTMEPGEIDGLSDATGDTLRTGDNAELQEGEDQAESGADVATLDEQEERARKKGKQDGKVATKHDMSFSMSYRFRQPHIVPFETMRANKQRELHAHVGSMSSMYVRGGFKPNVERTRESMRELRDVMVDCRERLTQLQETTGKSLQEKEQVYKGIIDSFTVEWNDSYFVKLKDVEEQIQAMNQKRIENPWMDMLLILLSWLVRGLFYIVEGVTIVIIIVRHAWGKAKRTFQGDQTARRERDRFQHSSFTPPTFEIQSGENNTNVDRKLSSPAPNGDVSTTTTAVTTTTTFSSSQQQHTQQRARSSPVTPE